MIKTADPPHAPTLPLVYHSESFPNFCFTLPIYATQHPSQTVHLTISQSNPLPGKPNTVLNHLSQKQWDTDLPARGILGSSQEDLWGSKGCRIGQRETLNHGEVPQMRSLNDPTWSSRAGMALQGCHDCVQGLVLYPTLTSHCRCDSLREGA